MDIMGDHAVTCKFGPSRIARHDGVNKAWAFALKGAGMAVKMEVYTDLETRHRSADTLVDGWEFGRSAAHDWVVSHTLQKAAIEAGKGRRPNFTLEQSERRKNSYAKRRCEARGLDFRWRWIRLEKWENERSMRLLLRWHMRGFTEGVRCMIGMCRGEGWCSGCKLRG